MIIDLSQNTYNYSLNGDVSRKRLFVGKSLEAVVDSVRLLLCQIGARFLSTICETKSLTN